MSDNNDQIKKYVMSATEYMGIDPDMYSFKGTYRQLLEHLTNMDDENAPEEVEQCPYIQIGDYKDWLDFAKKAHPQALWRGADSNAPREADSRYEGFWEDNRQIGMWDGYSGAFSKPLREWTDEDFERLFDSGNGDGQPYVMVFCVEDDKKVLG